MVPEPRTEAEQHAHRTRVLIAGGGVAAVEALLALRAMAENEVEIDLLAPQDDFVDRPMAVGEPFDHGLVRHFDLGVIAAQWGARLHPGGLREVDAEAKLVRTTDADQLHYDALLIACGARPVEWLSGALTFRGPADAETMRQILGELEGDAIHDVVFALPGSLGWPLPLYELALMTAAWLDERAIKNVRLRFITPESAPLEVFGRRASEAVAGLMTDSGIRLRTETYPAAHKGTGVELVPIGWVPAERVVTLPRLQGRDLGGLERNADGFISVDEYCRVRGLSGVYAAGDATDFPIKQGGIATQQADTAAEVIAAEAGASVEPKPFRPVLRGVLLTGKRPEFLRAALIGGKGETSAVGTTPLWWPPSKLAGKYLGPYLGALTEAASLGSPPEQDGVLKIEEQLDINP